MTNDNLSSTGRGAQDVELLARIEQAAVQGKEWVKSSKARKGALVPNWFIRRAGESISPLAELADARIDLALYLTLLLKAKQPDDSGAYSIDTRVRELAMLFGHPYASPKAARLARDSLHRMQNRQALTLRPIPDRGPEWLRLTLMDWDGRGSGGNNRLYEPPKTGYVTIPKELWSQGWHVALSPRALAMLLISLDMEGFHSHKSPPDPDLDTPPNPTTFWVSPAQANTRYGLHPDTRARGWKELVEHGILIQSSRRVDSAVEAYRIRNTYRINRSRLSQPPGLLPPPPPPITADNNPDAPPLRGRAAKKARSKQVQDLIDSGV